ncbi:MAG: response regulator, partial [Desulfobacterales bacterium]
KKASLNPDFRPGKYQKLTVEDAGHGIQPEIMDRIFDPFFSTKPTGEGTGLGLSVVHGIIKNHGGVVLVSSGPGEGTVFEVYFPVMEVEAPLVECGQSVSITQSEIKNQRILLIDDEAMLAAVGHDLLESLEYEVVAETSVHRALNIFRESPDKFDLVITDMTMPHMNGLDFAAEIRKIHRDIPIILCTGYSDSLSESAAKSVGIHEILTKPLTRARISEAVQKALMPRALSGGTSGRADIS